MRRLTMLCALFLVACGSSEPAAPSGPPEAGPIEEAWVTRRVEESRARMHADPAGQILWESIEAHGGLSAWLSRGTIAFEFDYQPVGNPERRMRTTSHIDLWRSRARQEEIVESGEAAVLGWNGEEAWITPGPDAFPSTARFWSLTPFYFVGIPFVLADPGTRYERLDDAELDGVAHRIVKVTYEDGTGDSPDDYYVIYVHPETHRVSAIRYIVAFPGFFEPGQHSPEKLMRYGDQREVDGLWLTHRFDTYRWDTETSEIGELATHITAGSYALGQTWPASHFDPVEGAHVTTEIELTPR